MFENFQQLSPKAKRHILISMMILIIPVTVYAAMGVIHMHQNKVAAVDKYDDRIELTEEQLTEFNDLDAAREVQVGVYMESITNVSVANDSWKTKFLLWFRWDNILLQIPIGYYL